MQKFILVLSVSIFILSQAQTQKIWTSVGANEMKPAEINLLHSSVEETTIRFDIPGFFRTQVETPQGKEVIIGCENGVQITQKGTPDLPKMFTSIIIPDLADMEIVIEKSDFTEFTNIAVAPSKGHFTRDINPDDVPYTYGPDYKTDTFWPGVITQLEDPFIFRDFRGQTVNIFPFQYNPVTKVLRVYSEITVSVKPSGKQGINPFVRTTTSGTFDPDFLQIYQRTFLNKGAQINSDYIISEEGSLLIICYDAFMPAMTPFVNWKRTIGRKTEMVSTNVTGTTATAIKNYVTNYYNTNPDFTHLLLVGDAPQINTNIISGNASDQAYGFLVGNDQYNEIFVGRFSSENISHVQTQVQRMIEYERDMNQTDTWMRTGMGIARNEGTGGGHYGENDYVHMNFIRDSLLNFTYDVVYRNYDGNVPGVPNTTAAIISQGINDGVTIINFCNHGSVTGWSVANYNITHVNSLTNVGKLPFIWSVACVNGDFVSNLCFAETWLRATHNGEPTGAIGTMMSTINQAWQPPMTGQDEMVTILVEKRDHIKRTFGGLSINGSMKMIPAHGLSGIETHVTWTLFGDPTLMVRTDVPQPFAPNYNPVLLLGTSSFTVAAPNSDGAYAAVTRLNDVTGEVTILGTAYFSGGTAMINFAEPLAEPENLTLALTGFNKETYLDNQLQVIPPAGPYVTYHSHTINDAAGNNNGLADYGESIMLHVGLENVGIETANNTAASLSTSDPYITITDNYQSWGNIAAGATSVQNNAFAMTIAGNVPDQYPVSFDLDITADPDNAWNSTFSVTINAPALQFGNLTINDNTGGNGNGLLDPGETADISVQVINNGHSLSPSGPALLTSASPWITINNGTFAMDPVAPGGQAILAFSVTTSPATPIGTPVDLCVDVSAGSYGINHTFYRPVGLVLEDWETGNFASFPWTFGGNLPWVITSADPYEGVYSAKSGAITHNQTSDLVVELNVSEAGNISFFRKVSSEAGYDYLRFYIDGALQAQWAGELAWGEVSFPVAAGPRTFSWRYYKDGYVSIGSDCAWIDYIVFPSIIPPPDPPEIVLNPLSFEVSLPVDASQVKQLTIGNTGDETLNFSILKNYIITGKTSTVTEEIIDEVQDALNLTLFEQALEQRIAAENPVKPEPNPLTGPADSFCAPSFTYGCGYADGFTDFGLEQIQNLNSGCANNTGFTGWSTYFGLGPAILDAGQQYTVTMRTGYSNQYVNIWIDFNDDNILTADERVLTNFSMGSANVWYNATITIPEDALPGQHKMRAMAVWNGQFSDPCGSYGYGEAEDYTVLINSGFTDWLTLDPASGTVPGSGSTNVDLTFNTAGLEIGTYYANVTVTSNDPVTPSVIIPCTLHVSGDQFVEL
ncbi:MAG: C25 family cysteine peptidase, partial [Bacteroidales bacterium]